MKVVLAGPAQTSSLRLKISPSDFWHGYPAVADWLVADNQGTVSRDALKIALDGLLLRSHQR